MSLNPGNMIVLLRAIIGSLSFLRSTGLPTTGDLSKWEDVGKPTLIADLLKQRRDSDASGAAPVESVVLPGATIDGDTLQVQLSEKGVHQRSDISQTLSELTEDDTRCVGKDRAGGTFPIGGRFGRFVHPQPRMLGCGVWRPTIENYATLPEPTCRYSVLNVSCFIDRYQKLAKNFARNPTFRD